MTPKTLSVYDPAMCCSTGVCGPDVDPELVRFTADLDWVTAQGVEVERFNLAQQPGAFVSEAAVKEALENRGDAALPMVLVDRRTVMSGAYPTRDELAGWLGLAGPAAGIDPGTAPRVGEGASGESGGCCDSSGPKDSSCC